MMVTAVAYYAVNCPYCKEIEIGAILANSSLPVGKKIILMDYHSDDRINDFLELKKIRGGKFVPQFLVLKDDLNFLGKRIKRGVTVALSTFGEIHIKTFIKRLEGLW